MNHAEEADTLAALPGDTQGKTEGSLGMDGLLPLFRVTPATEVAKKWNVTAERLNEIVNKCRLSLYTICDKRIRPDNGEIVYFCKGPYYSLYHEAPFGEGYYELEGMYFDAEIIELYENAYPEILWASPDARVTLEEKDKENTSADPVYNTIPPLHSGLKIISAYEVIRKLRITPYELVEILNGKYIEDEHGNMKRQRLITTKESSFREYDLSDPYFCEEDLANVKIYQCDFDKYCEQWEPQIYVGYDSEENNYDVREINSELLRLKQENVEQQKKIVEQQKKINELEAQLAATRGIFPEKRTDAANDTRAQNTVERWKATFPCMVRVYARMEQGRTYTRKEVAELFQGEGVDVSISKAAKVTDARLDYFWKLLTTSGRPIADLSSCGSPDVSAATTTDPVSTTTDHVLTTTDHVNDN